MVKRIEYPMLLHPPLQSPVAAVQPCQQLHRPPHPVNILQGDPEALPSRVTSPIPRKEHHNTRSSLVLDTIVQHLDLEGAVWHLLFSVSVVVTKLDLDSILFHLLPQLRQLRRDGSSCNYALHLPVAVGQQKQIGKVNPDSHPDIGRVTLHLLRYILGLHVYVRIIPVYVDIHRVFWTRLYTQCSHTEKWEAGGPCERRSVKTIDEHSRVGAVESARVGQTGRCSDDSKRKTEAGFS